MVYVVTAYWETRVPRSTRHSTPMGHRRGVDNTRSYGAPDLESAERMALDLVESKGALWSTFDPEVSR